MWRLSSIFECMVRYPEHVGTVNGAQSHLLPFCAKLLMKTDMERSAHIVHAAHSTVIRK